MLDSEGAPINQSGVHLRPNGSFTSQTFDSLRTSINESGVHSSEGQFSRHKRQTRRKCTLSTSSVFICPNGNFHVNNEDQKRVTLSTSLVSICPNLIFTCSLNVRLVCALYQRVCVTLSASPKARPRQTFVRTAPINESAPSVRTVLFDVKEAHSSTCLCSSVRTVISRHKRIHAPNEFAHSSANVRPLYQRVWCLSLRTQAHLSTESASICPNGTFHVANVNQKQVQFSINESGVYLPERPGSNECICPNGNTPQTSLSLASICPNGNIHATTFDRYQRVCPSEKQTLDQKRALSINESASICPNDRRCISINESGAHLSERYFHATNVRPEASALYHQRVWRLSVRTKQRTLSTSCVIRPNGNFHATNVGIRSCAPLSKSLVHIVRTVPFHATNVRLEASTSINESGVYLSRTTSAHPINESGASVRTVSNVDQKRAPPESASICPNGNIHATNTRSKCNSSTSLGVYLSEQYRKRFRSKCTLSKSASIWVRTVTPQTARQAHSINESAISVERYFRHKRWDQKHQRVCALFTQTLDCVSICRVYLSER
ncbi:unnamed protein product [Acanthosepion pharaonis]|uniref:Uncharacterized protein n=1 Tax=Acanthosepion pharaonis TaxID=158019 RepID=A0A812B0C5_ACAPH|nr:unnamed protein product [Sepia pharaonis]